MASQTTSFSIVCSAACWVKQQSKHQSSTLLVPCEGNPSVALVDSPHKGPVLGKPFPCLAITMSTLTWVAPYGYITMAAIHSMNDIFKCIFLNENVWVLFKISLKLVPKVSISNIPAMVQIMTWRRPADKSLSEPMMVSLLTHICSLSLCELKSIHPPNRKVASVNCLWPPWLAINNNSISQTLLNCNINIMITTAKR